MAYPASVHPAYSLKKIRFLEQAIGQSARIITALLAAKRKRQTLRIVQSLPFEIRKDIGWQTGN